MTSLIPETILLHNAFGMTVCAFIAGLFFGRGPG